MNIDLITIITVIAFFQLSVLSAVVIKNKTGKSFPHNFLFAFLIVNALLVFNSALFIAGVFNYGSSWHYYYYYFVLSLFYSLAPILYFYIRSLLEENFSAGKKDLLHLLPMGVSFLFFIVNYNLFLLSKDFLILKSDYFFFFTFHLQAPIYLFLISKILAKRKRVCKNFLSTITADPLHRLPLIFAVFVIHWFFEFLSSMLNIFQLTSSATAEVFGGLSILSLLVFSTTLVFIGMTKPQPVISFEEKPKYSESKLSEIEKHDIAAKLENFMRAKKPYHNSNITIKELSENISVPVKKLSQIINELFEKNFFDFINSFRIEEAKEILVRDGNKTVLEILYEVGFNSKSVFNRVFKNCTGMTPNQFRESAAFKKMEEKIPMRKKITPFLKK